VTEAIAFLIEPWVRDMTDGDLLRASRNTPFERFYDAYMWVRNNTPVLAVDLDRHSLEDAANWVVAKELAARRAEHD